MNRTTISFMVLNRIVGNFRNIIAESTHSDKLRVHIETSFPRIKEAIASLQSEIAFSNELLK